MKLLEGCNKDRGLKAQGNVILRDVSRYHSAASGCIRWSEAKLAKSQAMIL